MPASRITLFCTGAVTIAPKSPDRHASLACWSIASTLCAFVGSGWPGTAGAASGCSQTSTVPCCGPNEAPSYST